MSSNSEPPFIEKLEVEPAKQEMAPVRISEDISAQVIVEEKKLSPEVEMVESPLIAK